MKNNFIKAWAKLVIKRRWWVIFITVICLGLLIMPMKNLYFDSSFEMWFQKNDSTIRQLNQFRDKYGNSAYLLVGIEARDQDPHLFNHDTLKMIAKLTQFLENHESVTKVSSLTKYQYLKSEDDTLYNYDLVEDAESRFNLQSKEDSNFSFGGDDGFDTDDEFEEEEYEELVSFAEMAEVMNSETLVHDMLITSDLRHTVISAKPIYKKDTLDHHVKLTDDLKNFIKKEGFEDQGFKLRLAGGPPTDYEFQAASTKDRNTTTPLMFLLIAVFVLISFRSVSGVLTPMIVVFSTMIAAVGTVAWFGWSFNIINSVLPLVLMAIAIGDAVHVIVDFYHYLNEGLDSKTAAEETVKTLWIPCFNTTLTTAIGFLAIASSDLVPIREYGIVAAISVFIAFIISVSTLPAILSFVKTKPQHTQKLIESGLVAKFTQSLAPFTFKYRKPITAIALLIATIGMILSLQIKVDSNILHYFRENTQIRNDAFYFDKVFNGYSTLEFSLDSGEKGGIKNPSFLKEALEFQTYLEGLDETGKANSILNLIRHLNKILHNDDPNYYVLPNSRELVAQYLFLYQNTSPEEDLSDLKDFNERSMRISLKLKNMSTTETKLLIDRIKTEMNRKYSNLNGKITGDTVLYVEMDNHILQGIAQSLLIAIGLIVICFFILLRSFKYGLFCLVPSIIPILLIGGLMFIIGRAFDFSTMIVGAITIGVTVDDTIHVMVRYLKALSNGHTQKEAVHLAMTESGRAIAFTSIILFCGFSMNILSSFVPMIYFGIFTALIIMFALLGVLVLLPAVLFVFDRPEETLVID